MKIAMIIAITIAILGGYGYSACKAAGQQSSGKNKVGLQHTGFYCNIKALNPAETKHHAEPGESLRAAKRSVHELADGYEFEFPGDAAAFQAAAEWSALERRCCPFFEFTLRMERDNGPVWLRITGREGVKQFIQADMGSWLNARI